MKKKERKEVKELIDLLIRCDKCLTTLAESSFWPNGYMQLFQDLEKFGITDLWYGKTHSKSLNNQINEYNLEVAKTYNKENKDEK